jgi:hypothetical protein
MHHYKTAAPAACQSMSHTILKDASDHTRIHTLFNQVSGMFEVYWEQMHRPKTTEATHPKNVAHEGCNIATKHVSQKGYCLAPKCIAHEGFSLTPKDAKRSTPWLF